MLLLLLLLLFAILLMNGTKAVVLIGRPFLFNETYTIASSEPCFRTPSFHTSSHCLGGTLQLCGPSLHVEVLRTRPWEWPTYAAFLMNECASSSSDDEEDEEDSEAEYRYWVDRYRWTVQIYDTSYSIFPELCASMVHCCVHNICPCRYDERCRCQYDCENATVTLDAFIERYEMMP